MQDPRRRRFIRLMGILGAAVVVIMGQSAPARRLVAFPSKLQLPQGQDAIVPWSRWLPMSVASGSRRVMIEHASAIDFHSVTQGHYFLQFRLFGWLPFKGVPVDVTKPLYLVPGGESVGILAHTQGLIVTHLSKVYGPGRVQAPAEAAGIEAGDVIRQVDGQTASSISRLQKRVSRDGRLHKPVHLFVQGRRLDRMRSVYPVWSVRTQHWQIGVQVRDHTSGVGTLTFYSPKSYQFTALGHSLTDGLTRRPVNLSGGHALGADIIGVVPATDNQPGQKVGVLAGPDNVSGTLVSNGQFGIVGHLSHRPLWGPSTPIPLALPGQVHTGPAQIITVLRGQRPQMFNVTILKTAAQYQAAVKGLLFQVTDQRLIRATGGVVQGMSGSPIIQDGRIVGAVTHVLINRPTLGFGCYAYWMEQQPAFHTG